MHGSCFDKCGSMINNNFYTTNPKIWKGINKETFMKFKFLQAAVAGLMLSICNMANAGLITGTNWDEDASLTSGEWSTSGGADAWDLLSTDITLHLPRIVANEANSKQGDIADLFSAIYNLFQSTNTLSTSGGSFMLGNHQALSALGFQDVNISFVGDYTVDVFTADTFRTTGNGTLFYGNGQSTKFDFWNIGTNNGHSASLSTMFNYAQIQDSNTGGTVDVPEPSTLAILALGIIGLASRKFKKQ